MTHTYRIIEAEPAHLAMLLANLRSDARARLECLGIRTKRAAWRAYRGSILRRTAFIDGEIAALGGVTGVLIAGTGYPWLATTPAADRLPVAFIRETREWMGEALAAYRRLVDYVPDTDWKALRFLELLRFEPTGLQKDIGGVAYREFELRRP